MVTLELDPIEGVLAILDEGATTGTNKFGLLLALIDIAPSVENGGFVDVLFIAEKLIELHWDHARSFNSSPLRQVASGNRLHTTAVLEVVKLHKIVGDDLSFELARPRIPAEDWLQARAAVARGTIKNPLRLLQRLRGDPPPFLFELVSDSASRRRGIRFVDGALDALIRYGPVLRDLVEFRFVRFVASINHLSLGPPIEDQIAEHLFGLERHMPPAKMRRELWALQGRRCIYSGRTLSDPSQPKSYVSVDHVVPWKRIRLSAAENLLLTSRSINSSKHATLLAPDMVDGWLNYLKESGGYLSQIAGDFGWPTDFRRVLTVVRAQYLHATPASPVWNALEGVSALGEEGRERIFDMLHGF